MRLPGIKVLIALVAVMLLAPMMIVGVDLVRESRDAAAAADRAQTSVAELDILLRLAPALREEHNTIAGWIGAERLRALDPDHADQRAASLVVAQERVDGLVLEYGDESIVDDLDAIRDFGTSMVENVFVPSQIVELLARYDALFGRIQSLIESTMLDLRTAASSAGADADLNEAATIAEIGTERRVLHASQFTLWGSMSAPGVEPSNAVVLALADNLALSRAARDQLTRLIDDDSLLADAWAELRESGELLEFVALMYSSVDERLTNGTANTAEEPSVAAEVGRPAADLSDDEVLSMIDRMSEVQVLEQEAARALSDFVDAALAEVRLAAADVRAEATAAQWSMAIGVLAFVLLALAAVWLLVRAVVVPVRRLARHGRALRDGDMDRRLSISGTTELRLTAAAMNEAAASLKLAERQAVALAEGRMDDDSLGEAAPGRLGASLRHAVERLANTISEREHFQRRLAHEAAHDGLTGLPNRSAVLRNASAAIARAERTSMGMALLFLDLDGFKDVNDNFGHSAGDTLLRVTADRLRDGIREGDVAGRLGGDEFVVVAEPVAGLADALALGHRLRASICRPVEVGELEIEPSVSIGVALTERAGLSAEELLHDADLAVYRAKQLGRGRVEICDEDLREEARQQIELEQALTAALENDEFVLHYQPIVDCQNRRVHVLEALLRWDRPGHGLVLPGAFIPTAERSDLVEHIDRWVLDAVARQLTSWAEHPILGHIPITVNVSSRHLSSGQLVDDVLSAIDTEGIDRNRMHIEVTETALLDDLDRAASDLERLRSEGVSIALDDFGTGYMSLATLRALPVDIVKIDRSFVAEMGSSTNHSLVELIINAGRVLGIDVIAEGVERPEQAQTLNELGAVLLQGWLYAQPAPVADVVEVFERDGASAFVDPTGTMSAS